MITCHAITLPTYNFIIALDGSFYFTYHGLALLTHHHINLFYNMALIIHDWACNMDGLKDNNAGVMMLGYLI